MKSAPSDEAALKIVREHERMKTALNAIADACARKMLGAFRFSIADLADRGLGRTPEIPSSPK